MRRSMSEVSASAGKPVKESVAESGRRTRSGESRAIWRAAERDKNAALVHARRTDERNAARRARMVVTRLKVCDLEEIDWSLSSEWEVE